MNQLVSYSDTTHPFYFLTCFVEGLRADIRSVVMVQRPTYLDTACSLALLQEEVTEGECASPPRQTEHRYFRIPARSVQQQPLSTPHTPVGRAVDNRGLDSARNTNDEKLVALRNYRRAKGLCFKCGERSGRELSCPQIVQLRIVEELLALFSQDELTGSESPETSSEEIETACSISLHALTGSTTASGVIQLHAFIAKHEVLILIDSGSSASFINKKLASQLPGCQLLNGPCRE